MSTHTGVVFDDDEDKEPGQKISPIKDSLGARKQIGNSIG